MLDQVSIPWLFEQPPFPAPNTVWKTPDFLLRNKSQTYSPLGQLVGQVPVATTRQVLPALAPGRYHVVLRGASGERLATRPLVIVGHQANAGR